MNSPSSDKPERIDVNDKAACESWVRRLNITHEKLREVVGAVGDDPRKVEEHLRRSSEQPGGGRPS
jgi:hypothetical protein